MLALQAISIRLQMSGLRMKSSSGPQQGGDACELGESARVLRHVKLLRPMKVADALVPKIRSNRYGEMGAAGDVFEAASISGGWL
jgi:hypothetical protein